MIANLAAAESNSPDESTARRALEAWEIVPDALVLLAHETDAVWRVWSGELDLVLRLARNLDERSGIAGELAWLSDLGQRALPVPVPIPLPTGELCTMILDEGHPVVASLLTFLAGDTFAFPDFLGLTEHDAALAGDLIARLHDSSETFIPLPGFWRSAPGDISSSCGRPLDEVVTVVQKEFGAGALVAEVAVRSSDYLAICPTLMLHADLHPANMVRLKNSREIAAIDFGDCGFAPPAYDLAVFLAATRFHRPELHEPFLKAYRNHLAMDCSALALFEAVRHVQDLVYMATEPDHPYFLLRRSETATILVSEIRAQFAASA